MQKSVLFMGLGYIGLPTAALVADAGLQVTGVDINENVVNNINNCDISNQEPGLQEIVEKNIRNGRLKASLTPSPSDVFLIVVPTPFNEHHQPDISYVNAATRQIIPYLKKGDLYILESTSPVGTTQKMAQLIFSERPELEDQIYTPESTREAMAFYSHFVSGSLHSTNSPTAEMCKLVENSSRDVQIAFANELSIICDKAGINVWELIQLANKHPRVNILQPGAGVGGHCIAVDPYFITSDFPLESQLIGKAREINNYKAFWCAEKIKNTILTYQLENKRKPKVALMGLAFKADIDDLRESPAKYIAEKIVSEFPEACLIVEPNISQHPQFQLSETGYAYRQADIIAFLVAHKEFKTLPYDNSKLILDFCGIFKK